MGDGLTKSDLNRGAAAAPQAHRNGRRRRPGRIGRVALHRKPHQIKSLRFFKRIATSRTGGVFRRLGDLVVRRPLVVIGAWVALAVVLSMTCPSLDDMIEEHPVAFLPTNSPVSVTTAQMTEAFHDKGSDNVLIVRPDR